MHQVQWDQFLTLAFFFNGFFVNQLETSRSGTVFWYVLISVEITVQDETAKEKLYNNDNNAIKF